MPNMLSKMSEKSSEPSSCVWVEAEEPVPTVTLIVFVYEPHLTVSFALPLDTPFIVMTLTSVPVTFTTLVSEFLQVTTAVA